MEWVCPPQTSISTHRRVAASRMRRSSGAEMAPSRYSSRYFIAEILQHFQRTRRLLGVDFRDGEADVDQHELAGPRIGHVLQADGAGNAAEPDLAEQQVLLAIDVHQLTRNAQAHRR